MAEIAVQGMNDGMSVGDNKIKIKHIASLFPGKREVTSDIHNLQAVIYKKAYISINGLLKLVSKRDNPMLCQMTSLHQMRKDELAIILRVFENTSSKDAEHFHNYVVDRLSQIRAVENNQL